MKKFASARLMAAAVLMMGILFVSGCGSSYSTAENTLFVKKNGSLVETSVLDMTEEHYNEEELEQFIDEEISSFTESSEGTVKKKSFKVSDTDGLATLIMEFDSPQTYAEFNNVDFFAGTVVQGLAAGYAFDAEFYSTEAGSSTDDADSTEGLAGTEAESGSSDGSQVSKSEVVADPDYYVVILKENVAVDIKGEIRYVSQNAEVTGKNTAKVTGYDADSTETGLTYIIYK